LSEEIKVASNATKRRKAIEKTHVEILFQLRQFRSRHVMQTAKPIMILMSMFYGAGADTLAPLRPDSIDKPLAGFHADVNEIGRLSLQVALEVRDAARSADNPLDIVPRASRALARQFVLINGRR
jgi:hypothetical protein